MTDICIRRALNLQGKKFIIPSKGWYNLHTNSIVDSVPKEYASDEEMRICGTKYAVDCCVGINSNPNLDNVTLLKWDKIIKETYGVVKHIVDGDTFDAAIFVPFSAIPNIVGKCGKGGFYTCIRCRLSGVDAAEKNTEQGKEAIKLVTALFEQYKNKVYIHLNGTEKYGRVLATVLVGGEVDLSKYLINYHHPTLGEIARPYDGGKRLPW